MQIQQIRAELGESGEICGHFRERGTIVCNHPDGWGDCILNRPDRSCPYKHSIVEYFEGVQDEGSATVNR